MNRRGRRLLAVSGLAISLLANGSMAQRVSVGSSDDDLVHEHIVVTPNGNFLVNDDGSLGAQIAPAGGQNSSQGNGASGLAQSARQIQARMRQASEDSLRKALGSSDQEWAVLLPKIQRIMTLQSAVMPGSRLKGPMGGTDAAGSFVQLAARVQEFQKLVATDNVSDAQLAQSLASVREARDKVKVELVQARKELTEVLTQRQEAVLFDKGILAD